MPKDNKNFFKVKKEWSEIKDSLLGCYLPQYFQKVLWKREPILYVDCFAGKGKFEDGKDGSPRIALQIKDKSLEQTKVANPQKISTCFIDLNYAADLTVNISDLQSNGVPHIISGKFEEEIEKLLSDKQGYNVFLYIDPYGYQALDSLLFDKFPQMGLSSIELLINMNSFGLFRDACRVMKVTRQKTDEAFSNLDDIVEYDPAQVDSSAKSEDLLTNVCGGDYWKEIVNNYNAGKITGYQAEDQFSVNYRKRLRKNYNFVLDMPIRIKEGGQPKYRMVHATNHEDGCFLMAQNMQTRRKELFTNVQQHGVEQMTFWDLNTSMTKNIDNQYITIDEIKIKLCEHLKKCDDKIHLRKLLTTFVNDYGLLCEFKIIYNLLDALQDEKKIIIDRNPANKANGQPTTFWEENHDHQIVIRRMKL